MDDLTNAIIGATVEVHKRLAPDGWSSRIGTEARHRRVGNTEARREPPSRFGSQLRADSAEPAGSDHSVLLERRQNVAGGSKSAILIWC